MSVRLSWDIGLKKTRPILLTQRQIPSNPSLCYLIYEQPFNPVFANILGLHKTNFALGKKSVIKPNAQKTMQFRIKLFESILG